MNHCCLGFGFLHRDAWIVRTCLFFSKAFGKMAASGLSEESPDSVGCVHASHVRMYVQTYARTCARTVRPLANSVVGSSKLPSLRWRKWRTQITSGRFSSAGDGNGERGTAVTRRRRRRVISPARVRVRTACLGWWAWLTPDVCHYLHIRAVIPDAAAAAIVLSWQRRLQQCHRRPRCPFHVSCSPLSGSWFLFFVLGPWYHRHNLSAV